jgi:uncharacterized membrane protein
MGKEDPYENKVLQKTFTMNTQLSPLIRLSVVRSVNHTKSKTAVVITAIALLAALSTSTRLAAQQLGASQSEKFTTIDVPGGNGTSPESINPRGDIVGLYFDSSGNEHGFLLSKGKFTTIDVPEAVGTGVFGINPEGEIVGGYLDSNFNVHGFLLSKGRFTTIDVPGNTFGTALFGINPQGEIVGAYDDTSGNQHGFLLSN